MKNNRSSLNSHVGPEVAASAAGIVARTAVLGEQGQLIDMPVPDSRRGD